MRREKRFHAPIINVLFITDYDGVLGISLQGMTMLSFRTVNYVTSQYADELCTVNKPAEHSTMKISIKNMLILAQ